MNKTVASIFFADSIIAAGIVVWVILGQVAQVVPPVTTGWQTIGFVAVIGLQAYGMYIQSQTARSTQGKVDGVHNMLNSQLDKFKSEAAEQYRLALEQGISLARASVESESDKRAVLFEARITALETKLEVERAKAVVLAAAPIVAPEKRLEEIRGQQ